MILRVVMAVLLVTCTPVWAQKEDPKAKSAALVDRAAELSDLQGRGSPGFKLRARFTIRPPTGNLLEGSYVLIWVSPDQWREEISFPGYSRLRVGEKGQYTQARSLDFEPYQVRDLANLLEVAKRLRKIEPKKLRKARDTKVEGRVRACIDLNVGNRMPRDLCFDPDSGALVQDRFVYPNGVRVYQYNDYAVLAEKHFPRSLRYFESGQDRLGVTVDELVLIIDPDESLFVHPANGKVWKTCDNPTPSRLLEKQSAALDLMLRFRGNFDAGAYAVIGTNGRLHSMRIVRSAGPAFDKEFLTYLEKVRYRPKMCDGQPVEEETLYELGAVSTVAPIW